MESKMLSVFVKVRLGQACFEAVITHKLRVVLEPMHRLIEYYYTNILLLYKYLYRERQYQPDRLLSSHKRVIGAS